MSNNCCVYAIRAIEYCSTKFTLSEVYLSNGMYVNESIFIQSFLTYCQRQSPTLSDFCYISSVMYIRVSLPQQCISNQFEVTCIDKRSIFPNTVSHFMYLPLFRANMFLTEMLESNIFYDNLLIDILSG